MAFWLWAQTKKVATILTKVQKSQVDGFPGIAHKGSSCSIDKDSGRYVGELKQVGEIMDDDQLELLEWSSPGFVDGQVLPEEQIVNQMIDWCSDREVRVWGETEDVQLFRGDEKRVLVNFEGEVDVFCGRERGRFFCPQSRTVSFVNVRWEPDGTLILQRLTSD